MTSLQGAVFAVALGVAALAAQQAATPGGIPPMEYPCPHHGDHLQAKPGTCPMPMEGAPGGICRMQLVPVRIDSDLWDTCPVHANVPNVLGRTPGLCPIDRRPKMPVGVTVRWRCWQSPDEELMEPGRCGDGLARETVHLVRAHGDHNPRHGGAFFMASDAWHHVEGTYPQALKSRARDQYPPRDAERRPTAVEGDGEGEVRPQRPRASVRFRVSRVHDRHTS
jgi:hypothetical protein